MRIVAVELDPSPGPPDRPIKLTRLGMPDRCLSVRLQQRQSLELGHERRPDRLHLAVVDHGNVVADLFAATSTPHVYVFGADGRLVYRGLVDDDQRDRNPEGRQDYLRDTLTKLLAGGGSPA